MPGLVTNGEFQTHGEHSPAIRFAFEKQLEYDLIIASCGHVLQARYTLV